MIGKLSTCDCIIEINKDSQDYQYKIISSCDFHKNKHVEIIIKDHKKLNSPKKSILNRLGIK